MTDGPADTDSTEPAAVRTAPARPRRRRGRRGVALRLALLTAFLPVVFAMVAALSLIGREVTAPSWVRQEIETRVAGLIGGTLTFSDIKVTLGRDLHPRVRLNDALLLDGTGRRIARIPAIEALFSPRGLLFERSLMAQEVRITGAEISLARAADGSVAVAFDTGGAVQGEAPDLASLLAGVDAAASRPELAALEQVRAQGLVINYTDARAGRSWTVDDGLIAMTFGRDDTEIAADLTLLSGRAEPTLLSARYTSAHGSRAADLALTVENAAAADIATQSPALSWLSVLDAPLSANLRGSLGEDGAIGPLNARLQIGAGALRPTAEARPIPFERARTYLTYDPGPGEIGFDLIEIRSAESAFEASGHAYLRGVEGGVPSEIWGQFDLSRLTTDPGGLYGAPLELTDGTLDLKLELSPFRLTIGAGSVLLGAGAATPGEPARPARLRTRGAVWTDPAGWNVALDARVAEIPALRALALWPAGWRPGTRGWFERNLRGGLFRDMAVSLRAKAGAEPVIALDLEFEDSTVRFLPRMPLIEGGAGFVQIIERGFALSLEEGHLDAPEGGRLDLAGSSMVIPVMGLPETRAEFGLRMDGPITALLSTLDQPPLRLISGANLPVSLAEEGRAKVSGRLLLPLGDGLTPDRVSYDMTAELTGVRAGALIPGRPLSADRLSLRATPEGLEIDGPVEVAGVPMAGVFRKRFAEGAPAEIEARVEISPRFLDSFNIALPEGSVRGAGSGQLDLTLASGAPPRFSLVSDLVGVGLSLPWVGWSKPAGTPGRLEVAGSLGAAPQIDRLDLSAPGLTAEGRIELGPGGAFVAARFSRLAVGSWLDAPVTLRNRGAGRPLAVDVEGGRLDLRAAAFGGGGGGGAGGPLTIALDRLQVTQNLALTDFAGSFVPEGGLGGSFAARVNGGPLVEGRVAPMDGRTGVLLTSDNAGAVLRAAELLPNVQGGDLELILLPTGGEGTFDGALLLNNLRIRDAPAMAALLDAISVVGLLQQLDGQGLAFTSVDARFRMTPERIIVTESSAVGPSLGVSLDGTYTHASQQMNFQGVVSPFYILNGIGSVLTRPGEGLIGFNFTLTGPVGQPRVSVNPLSALTPGMFREIFRRPPPEVSR
ncbi:AsmA-like C-terminal region-containing protein [Roseisalinus antarcticus]|uniref:Uncharacterized protein n=1 Tax=Roseisalinus antarcticus TaxID=254357 RepID=A0A1Y5RJ16_9RHOB|nr:AsmA-like C-terminal region-containing protein [Roseisalinus antarcticus]SLN17576.1 hypothetical protein ROA7023_00322 [Roseisalinus antarcticus]